MSEATRPVARRASQRTEEVSELDTRIIEHLREDGRRPFTQIAADLGISEAAVRARTSRLVDRGVLRIVGLTDPRKLGLRQLALVGVRCEGNRVIPVAEAVAGLADVRRVVITAGTFDLLVEMACEDNESLLSFLTDQLRAVDGVRDTETFVYLREVTPAHRLGGS